MKYIVLSAAALFATLPVHADPARYIKGSADPGAQIVVTSEDTGSVMGYVAAGDGTYRAGPLAPGRYSIVEQGAHHAVRHLSVSADRDGEVDLAPRR